MRKIVSTIILIAFTITSILSPVHAQATFLPAVGSMVTLSAPYNPSTIKGIKFFPDNPFAFDFIIDTGDAHLSQNQLKEESQKQIAYFLASLTTPDKEVWVNLSPYENNRIISPSFGQTTMGTSLLAQDYLLKQIMATALYPESEPGKEFWKRVYAQAQEQFGTIDIPIDTFNKVWIMPDEAIVYENARVNSVFVIKSSLKLMLEHDYMAAHESKSIEQYGLPAVTTQETNRASNLSTRIIKEIVIPALEKEVNEGENFAPLRQMYQALILAKWYKANLKDNVISKAYVNNNKTQGIDVDDKNIITQVYNQYLQTYREGVYNFIKETVDPLTHESIPRKYFSGGFSANDLRLSSASSEDPRVTDFDAAMLGRTHKIVVVAVGLALGLSVSLTNTHSAQAAANVSFDPNAHTLTFQLENGEAPSTGYVDAVQKAFQQKVGYGSFLKNAQSQTITVIDHNKQEKTYQNGDMIQTGSNVIIHNVNFNEALSATQSNSPATVSALAEPLNINKTITLSPHVQTTLPQTLSFPNIAGEPPPVKLLANTYKIHIQTTSLISMPVKSFTSNLSKLIKSFQEELEQRQRPSSTSTSAKISGGVPPPERTTFSKEAFILPTSFPTNSADFSKGYFPEQLVMAYYSKGAFKTLVYPFIPSPKISSDKMFEQFQQLRLEFERIVAKDIRTNHPNKTANIQWMFPQHVKYQYSDKSSTPTGHHHGAWDIFTNRNEPVLSLTDGIVIVARDNWYLDENNMPKNGLSSKAGNAVLIYDPWHKIYTYYAHLNTVNIKEGQKIFAGTKLGTVGTTGLNASKKEKSPHLHFEIKIEDFNNRGLVSPKSLKNIEFTLMKPARKDRNLITKVDNAALNGGIDLEKVNLQKQGSGVKTAFSDTLQLKLLTNASGLTPVIYELKPVTAPIMSILLGITKN
ncbi:MAG: M23 family metallopeptidase [Candidatus Omnitrophota bacterium]